MMRDWGIISKGATNIELVSFDSAWCSASTTCSQETQTHKKNLISTVYGIVVSFFFLFASLTKYHYKATKTPNMPSQKFIGI